MWIKVHFIEVKVEQKILDAGKGREWLKDTNLELDRRNKLYSTER